MKMFELGKCCKIVSGSTPSRNTPEFWDGNIHWFTPKDLSGLASKYVYEAPEKITKEGFKSCSTNLIPSNSLLFSSRAPIGHIAINKLECCTNQGFKTMIPSENLDVEYLYYAIKRIVPQLQDMGNGATFKELSKSIFEKVVIPLPPLDTQKKIAAILDAADAYRKKTKTLIDKYDQLAQSLFLDMFGDVLSNLKRWEVVKLQSLFKNKSDIVDGPFGSSVNTKIDYIDNGEIPVIRTKNVSIKNEFIFDDLKFMTREKFETVKRSHVLPGDIILTKVGTIGNVCIFPDNYPEAVLSTTGSCRMRINESLINKVYFIYYLNFYKPKMHEIASAGVQAFLNMQHIKGFDVMLPTLLLQNQFAERIQLVEAQKQQAQASLQKAEDLFNSLLQQAFKGELVN